jgi:hypothetical protein
MYAYTVRVCHRTISWKVRFSVTYSERQGSADCGPGSLRAAGRLRSSRGNAISSFDRALRRPSGSAVGRPPGRSNMDRRVASGLLLPGAILGSVTGLRLETTDENPTVAFSQAHGILNGANILQQR